MELWSFETHACSGTGMHMTSIVSRLSALDPASTAPALPFNIPMLEHKGIIIISLPRGSCLGPKLSSTPL